MDNRPNGAAGLARPATAIGEFPSQRPVTRGFDVFFDLRLNRRLIKISLKFVPKGPIDNISALVQIMAWRRSGDKPLSEPMMVSLLTHICVTRSQWVKLKACDISLVIHISGSIVLKCCTVCVSITVKFYARFKIDWATEKYGWFLYHSDKHRYNAVYTYKTKVFPLWISSANWIFIEILVIIVIIATLNHIS